MGTSKAVYPRTEKDKEKTRTHKNGEKRQTMIYKIIQRKFIVEQLDPHNG